jgi:hypothetical protein
VPRLRRKEEVVPLPDQSCGRQGKPLSISPLFGSAGCNSPPLPCLLLLGFLTHTPPLRPRISNPCFPIRDFSNSNSTQPPSIGSLSNSSNPLCSSSMVSGPEKKRRNCERNMPACGSRGDRKILKMSVACGAMSVRASVRAFSQLWLRHMTYS